MATTPIIHRQWQKLVQSHVIPTYKENMSAIICIKSYNPDSR
jgi:microcompartment protein CcmL/EutN